MLLASKRRLLPFFLLIVGSIGLRGAVAAAAPKTIALLIAEPQYQTARTLPAFAHQFLEPEFKVELITGSTADGEVSFANLDALARADVLLVSVRRRTPPLVQMERIRDFVAAGKPVVGIRTASHAFKLLKGYPGTGNQDWPEWDRDVLGGNYIGHHPTGPTVSITIADAKSALVANVQCPFYSTGQLYRPSPLQPGTHAVLLGTIPDQPSEPVAWTYLRKDGGRTFYTSLGTPEDFENPSFQKLLVNGIRWAVSSSVGKND